MPDMILGPAPADFAPVSATLEARGGRRVRVRDDDGDHDAYQMPDGAVVAKALRIPSPAKAAANAATLAARTTAETRTTNNRDRIATLGRRAARYARDPVANAADDFWPTLTGAGAVAGKRAACELLARLALAEATDDQ